MNPTHSFPASPNPQRLSNMSYQAQPHMIVVPGGGNRNAKNLPVGPEGREWSNGLCSCCDTPGTFCLACWCPCISFGRIRGRYKHLNSKGTADPDNGGTCGSDCWIHCLTGCLGVSCLMQMWNRGDMRQRYNIKGNGCGDFCTACWCVPCELTQESRELELEEQSLGHTKH